MKKYHAFNLTGRAVVMLAALCAFAACNNLAGGGPGLEPEKPAAGSVSYTGANGGERWELTITENAPTASARYAAKAGDRYVLKVYRVSDNALLRTSEGTVEKVAAAEAADAAPVITLKSGDAACTVTVQADETIAFAGTIVFTVGEAVVTESVAVTLVPVTPVEPAPAKPTASLAAGDYTEVQTVSLSGDGDAEIWYTTDGGEPARGSGTRYTAPFRLNRTCVLKAAAIKNGAPASEVLTVEYTINVPLTWTMVNIPPFTPMGFALAYGDGTFIAGGAKKLAYSTDGGINWPLVDPQPLTAGNIRGIAFGNGTFVAGGKGETAWSTDGVEWTKSEDNEFGTEYIFAVAFGNNTFVAVGAKGKMAYSTDNGRAWEPVGTSRFAATEDINGIAWGGGRFIAVGAAGKTAYSADGQSWTAGPVLQNPTSGSLAALSGITYGNGTFVLTAPGPDGYVAYSADEGATWTRVTPAPGNNIKIPCVAWGGGRFVVGSNGGHIVWSPDGVEWTDTLWADGVAVASVVNNIAYGTGRFVAIGQQLGPGNVTIMVSNEQE